MLKTKERLFGAMPPWAKTGPIDLRNYNYRAEAHCADRSKDRDGLHPTISLESAELPAWSQYFERHLGGHPRAFQLLLDGTIVEMTLPEQEPQWFDPSFFFDPRWRSAVQRAAEPRQDMVPWPQIERGDLD